MVPTTLWCLHIVCARLGNCDLCFSYQGLSNDNIVSTLLLCFFLTQKWKPGFMTSNIDHIIFKDTVISMWFYFRFLKLIQASDLDSAYPNYFKSTFKTDFCASGQSKACYNAIINSSAMEQSGGSHKTTVNVVCFSCLSPTLPPPLLLKRRPAAVYCLRKGHLSWGRHNSLAWDSDCVCLWKESACLMHETNTGMHGVNAFCKISWQWVLGGQCNRAS